MYFYRVKVDGVSNILITGCAGFIGSHLTERLLDLGNQVIGIDNFDTFYAREIKVQNLSKALQHPQFHFFEGDILDTSFLEKIFSHHHVDVVIHLAAKAGVRSSFLDADSYFRVNTLGTKNIFEVASKNGVQQFVLASSSSVYGEMEGEKAIEDLTPLNPLSPYAQSKVDAETVVAELQKAYNFDVNVLRFFTVYGERQRPDMAFQKFRNQILKGETIQLYGEGMSRDFTPIEKILHGIVACLDYRNGFEVFNLGSGERVLVKDMILKIGEGLGVQPQIEVVQQQKGDPSFTLASIEKAKNLLGYTIEKQLS